VRVVVLALGIWTLWTAQATAQASAEPEHVRSALLGYEHEPPARLLRALGPRTLAELIAIHADRSEPTLVRMRALRATFAFPTPATQTFLLAVAAHGGPLFAHAALTTFARAFGREAIAELTRFLEDPRPLAREGAVVGLIRTRTAEGVRIARAHLERETSDAVRHAGAQTLSELAHTAGANGTSDAPAVARDPK
jgi:hypothetical protein